MIGISFRGRNVVVPKPETYNDLIQTASRRFSVPVPTLSCCRLEWSTDIHAVGFPRWEISEESYNWVRDNSAVYFIAPARADDDGYATDSPGSVDFYFDSADSSSGTTMSPSAANTDQNNSGFQVEVRSEEEKAEESSVTVRAEADESISPLRSWEGNSGSASSSASSSDKENTGSSTRYYIWVNVNIYRRSGDLKARLNASPCSKIRSLCDALKVNLMGERVLFDGDRVQDLDVTLHQLGVANEDTLEIHQELVGGKPAIYLLSPVPIDNLKVSIALRKEWNFTILYPLRQPTKKDPNKGPVVTWEVSVQPGGTMQDRRTNTTKFAYLFWEAAAFTPKTILPGDGSMTNFNPENPFTFINGQQRTTVTLPFKAFLEYVDQALKGLTLTPAQRTDFIVYWLPTFSRIRMNDQKLRCTFVPQKAFEKAAELTVEGATPKTISRIFMLFGGVPMEENDGGFDHGVPIGVSNLHSINWGQFIGMDVAGMQDESTFRVLEWGAMEVPLLKHITIEGLDQVKIRPRNN